MRQCKEFYEALERGDGIGAHYLYIPKPVESSLAREFRERSEQNWANYQAEKEYLENLPKEFHKDELRYQLRKRGFKDEHKKKSLFRRLFG